MPPKAKKGRKWAKVLGGIGAVGAGVAAPFTGGTSLAWLPKALAVMGAGGTALGAMGSGTTPAWNPNATAPATQAPQTDQAEEKPGWLSENAPWIATAGLGTAGTVLGAREQGRANRQVQQRTEMTDRLAREEQARKEMYTSMILPSIAQGLNLRDPRVLGMLRQRLDSSLGGMPNPIETAPSPSDMQETEEERRRRLMEAMG